MHPAQPEFARAGHRSLPAAPLPEIAGSELTAGLLRAGILRDGCLLVRGLVPRDAALALAARDRPCVRRA